MGFTQKTFANTLLHTYILNWSYSKPDSQVMPCSQKKESWFYLHWLGSYKSNMVKNAYYIMTYSVASFDATQKNFGFLVSRAFQRYIIFSRYYTLAVLTYSSKYPCWQNTFLLLLVLTEPWWLQSATAKKAVTAVIVGHFTFTPIHIQVNQQMEKVTSANDVACFDIDSLLLLPYDLSRWS